MPCRGVSGPIRLGMPVYLQPVQLPERCFLGEVLFWMAFQRLPVAIYDPKGRDIRAEFDGLQTGFPERSITDEEAKRAGIPPDPEFRAWMEDRVTSPPSFYDDL